MSSAPTCTTSCPRDGGATWEGPARLDYGEEFTAAIMNVAQLSNGRIVLPLEYFDVERAVGKYVSKSCYSDDGGRTWRHDSTHPSRRVRWSAQSLRGGRAGGSRVGRWSGVDADSHAAWVLLRVLLRRRTYLVTAGAKPVQRVQFRPARPCGCVTAGCCSCGRTELDRPLRPTCCPSGPTIPPNPGAARSSTWRFRTTTARPGRGYREFVRVVGHEPDGARVGYPRFAELPDGDVMVAVRPPFGW